MADTQQIHRHFYRVCIRRFLLFLLFKELEYVIVNSTVTHASIIIGHVSIPEVAVTQRALITEVDDTFFTFTILLSEVIVGVKEISFFQHNGYVTLGGYIDPTPQDFKEMGKMAKY